uniref:AMP-activated protein kinase glycogen-binding domain-containing protein n=1 Tax=Rhodosorus marinus TaxID=101924 RepID=A0A7S0BLI2_9RHOD|mmetsp:Transcript_22071/g.31948  ORF Transcript_22071/g.31948 Transcript_22071/m.31948 type:complete len:568 (+) Transcript_22071:180-1883(+)
MDCERVKKLLQDVAVQREFQESMFLQSNENFDDNQEREVARGNSLLKHVRQDMSAFADVLPQLDNVVDLGPFCARTGVIDNENLISFVWQSNAKHIKVSASFDGYMTHPLVPTVSGRLGIVFQVNPGRHYYRFLVSGKWKVRNEPVYLAIDPGNGHRSNYIDVTVSNPDILFTSTTEKSGWFNKLSSMLPTSKFRSMASRSHVREKKHEIMDLIIRGRRFFKEANYFDAVGAYGRALDLSPEDPEIYSELGRTLMKMEQNTLAEIHLRTAISIYEREGYEAGKSYRLADILLHYGVLMDRIGEKRTAELYYKKALRVYRREGHEGINVRLARDNLLRNLKWQMSNDEKHYWSQDGKNIVTRKNAARDLAKAALPIPEREEDKLLSCAFDADIIRCRHDSNIEIVNSLMKDWYREAIKLKSENSLQKAVELLRRATFARRRYGAWVTPFTIEFLLEIANMLVKMDQYDEAEYNLRQAMSVWHMKSSAKDLLPEGEKWREETFADVLKMLGIVCDKAGRRLEAEEYYRSALEIYRSHGRDVKIVDTNRLLVINLCAQGKSVGNYERFLG